MVFLGLLLLSFNFLSGETPTLIVNMANEEVLPIHFRSFKDSKDLAELRVSGSGQFSEKGLQAILKRLGNPKELTVVDLRQESHGFLNGIAVSWFIPRDLANFGKSLAEIEKDEVSRLQEALKTKEVVLTHVLKRNEENVDIQTQEIPITVVSALTERELTEKFKLGYLRIPVTDHLAPEEVQVDKFVEFAKALPKDRWVHFHCQAGDGRTTSFLAMFDSFKNSKQVSFEAILARQWHLGGILLTDFPKKNNWKFPSAVARVEFLKQFYTYCQENKDDFKISFSEWKKGALSLPSR